MFERVIGKKCRNLGFKSCNVVVHSSRDTCGECGGPLDVAKTLDTKKVAALGLGVAVLVGNIVYLALKIKSYPDVEASRNTGQYAPAPTATDITNIKDLLRSIYSDGVKTAEEQAKLGNLASRHRVDPGWLDQQEQDIKDRSNRATISLKQGLFYASQQDYKQAAEEFKRGCQIDPDNVFLWANLATAYIKLSNLGEAQSACSKAIALDSRNWLAHYNLGALYASRGDKDAAIGELSEALRLLAEDKAKRITRAELTGHMKVDQSLNSLHTDPRFQQLLARN